MSLKEKCAKNLGEFIIASDNLWQILLYKKIAFEYNFRYINQAFVEMKEIPSLIRSKRFWLLDVPILFLPAFVGKGCYYFFEFLPMINAWRFSPKKYKRFAYHIYKIVRKFMRFIFNGHPK